MIGSHLPNGAVGAKVPIFGRGEGKMIGLFIISFCLVHNDVLFLTFSYSARTALMYKHEQ